MTSVTVLLSDFGIFPDTGRDCSEALQGVFDSLRYEDGTETRVVFPKGEYYVGHVILIGGARRLSVCGNGSKVVAHFDPTAPLSVNNSVFRVTDSDDVSFCDLVFDTDAPISAAGRIAAVDRINNTADLRIYDEFPVTGLEHINSTDSFDEKGSPDYALGIYRELTEEPYVTRDGKETTRLAGVPYDVIGDHLIRMYLSGPHPKLTVGHAVNLRYANSGGSVLLFASCRRILLQNIMIHSATFVGLVIRPRCEDLTLDRFCIRVPENSSRLYAANADGIHILGLMGKLTLKNCNMEGLGDDTLNIHGIAGGVHTLDTQRKTLSMVYPFRGQILSLPDKWAASGDTIYVYDSNTFLQKGSFVIDTVDEKNNVTYRDEVGEIALGDTLANSAYFASLHIDGCTVRSTRARGFLVQTHNVLIENSYIYGMSLAGLLFAPDIREWWEVGPSKNVEIRNNLFEHCAHVDSSANRGAILFNACHDTAEAVYPAGVHENIFIHHNRFRDIACSGIYVASSRQVRIEDNVFENCCFAPQDTSEQGRYDIVAVNCEDITLKGNVSDRGEDTLFCLQNCNS